MQNDIDSLIKTADLLLGKEYHKLKKDGALRNNYKDLLFLIDRYGDVLKFGSNDEFAITGNHGTYRYETPRGIFEVQKSAHDILVNVHYIKNGNLCYDTYQIDAFTLVESSIKEPLPTTKKEFIEKIGWKKSFVAFKKKMHKRINNNQIFFSFCRTEKIQIIKDGHNETYNFNNKLKSGNKGFEQKAGAKIPYVDNLLDQIKLQKTLEAKEVKELKKV